ncbi:MAG TPA: thiamine phosphate synthase [Acidobacteriaceae bacterium]|jgi:thiamine-phosphate pyrophosphorylase|nr:thiamine phosphate synthase [Acidobacteriaceae bacterium]
MIRYAITDRSQLPPQNANAEAERRISLFALARQWAEQQIDYIQLREKDLSDGEMEQIACAITAVIHSLKNEGLKSRTKLLLNSRADVALAAGADGVHLTAAPGRLTPAQVRTLFAQAGRLMPVVSISCHTLEQVVRAHREQADLILFGPVFGKTLAGAEVTPAAGLEALRSACNAAGDTPVLALGGVTESNAQSCLEAGAKGIAAIRFFADRIHGKIG